MYSTLVSFFIVCIVKQMKVTFRELSHPNCPLFSWFNLIIPSDVLLDVLDKDISPGHKDEAQCQLSWTCTHSCP